MSYPYNGNTGFSVNLASNHCVITTRLEDSTEHFPSTGTTRATCTRTLNLHYYHTRFLYSISYAYESLFSTFSSIFSFFFPLYPILIHQILQRTVGRLGMVHTTPRQCLWPVGSLSSDYSPTDMGRKFGVAVPLFGGGRAGSPSNTTSPGLRPTSIPSGTFIYPAIWPQ